MQTDWNGSVETSACQTICLLTAMRDTERVEGRGVAESCYRGGGEGGLRVCSLVRTSAEIELEYDPCVTPSWSYRSHTGRSNMSMHLRISVLLVSSPVLFHDVLERPQKVFLKPEVGQLALLQKLHGQLPERVHGKNGHVFVGITANLHGVENTFQEGHTV